MLTRNIFLLHSVVFFSRLKCILNFLFSTFSGVWYGEKHKLTENIFYSHWKTSPIEWKTFDQPTIDSSFSFFQMPYFLLKLIVLLLNFSFRFPIWSLFSHFRLPNAPPPPKKRRKIFSYLRFFFFFFTDESFCS